jgi:hypothetical protein
MIMLKMLMDMTNNIICTTNIHDGEVQAQESEVDNNVNAPLAIWIR